MAGNLELLRRIDEKDYLTEREHREFLDRLKKDLEKLEYYEEIFNKPLKNIRERLEILDILKEKEVDIPGFRQRIIDYEKDFDFYYNHWNFISYKPLTKEEFELIKGWLKNDM